MSAEEDLREPAATLGTTRDEVIGALRRMLPRLDGAAGGDVLPFGIADLDARLPGGGLALGALHEIAPETTADRPAALGFAVALAGRLPGRAPVFVVETPRGLAGLGALSAHGFAGLGLDPARLVLVSAADDRDGLWAVEEALHSGGPAGILAALGGAVDLKASQRLQRAAAGSGRPLLLLRTAGVVGTSVAMTRWRIAAAPAARDPFGLVAAWRWRVRLERCRNGRLGAWLLERDPVPPVLGAGEGEIPQGDILRGDVLRGDVSQTETLRTEILEGESGEVDHAAHRFRLAAALADPAVAERPLEDGSGAAAS